MQITQSIVWSQVSSQSFVWKTSKLLDIQRTNDNSSLYIKEGPDKKIVLVEIFVDDSLFIGNDDLCKAFSEEMSKEFKMSMFGEINFFVGLQIQ